MNLYQQIRAIAVPYSIDFVPPALREPMQEIVRAADERNGVALSQAYNAAMRCPLMDKLLVKQRLEAWAVEWNLAVQKGKAA